MYCGKCGKELVEGSKFCSICGAPVITEEPVAEEVNATEATPVAETVVIDVPAAEVPAVDPAQEKAKEDAAKSALTWGILSLVFALEGFIVSFLGIIFACNGFKKADWFAYLNNGVLTGKAKIGRILSKVGLILGIVMTVFWALYILLIIAGVVSSAEFSSDFYF